MKKIVAVILCVLCTAAVAGCEKKTQEPKEEAVKTRKIEDEKVIEGMLLRFGEDGMLFVEQETKVPFYVHLPEDEIYDEKDKKMEVDDMGDGDVFAFYGQEIVLESYPGQYPGITTVVRTKDGKKKDTEPYQPILDEIYQEPASSEIPFMDVENRRTDAVVTTVTEHFSYEWTAPGAEGKEETAVACGSHVLDAKDMEPIRFDEETSEVKLLFSKSPKSVKVTRWDKGTPVEDADKGEEVKVELHKKEAVISEVKSGSVYEVVATWEQGNVTYGFVVE